MGVSQQIVSLHYAELLLFLFVLIATLLTITFLIVEIFVFFFPDTVRPATTTSTA